MESMERAAFSLNKVFLYSSLPVAHTPSSMNQRTGKRLLFSFFLVVFLFCLFFIDDIMHFCFVFLCWCFYVFFCFFRHRGKVLTHSGVRLRVFLFFSCFFFFPQFHSPLPLSSEFLFFFFIVTIEIIQNRLLFFFCFHSVFFF